MPGGGSSHGAGRSSREIRRAARAPELAGRLWSLLAVEIANEPGVVLTRQRARQVAQLLGFDPGEAIRLATAVSEIARNAFQYAAGGRAEFLVALEPEPALLVRISDRGPGIADVQNILDGRYASSTGMGLGIMGARRLTDRFEIASSPDAGTVVLLGKRLPRRAGCPTAAGLDALAAELARHRPEDPYAEIQAQNQELLRTLAELRTRQAEVERLNRELAETNRGVVALYAELDERAKELAQVSELKSRFLSAISHELRTPLNSIMNISRLLLDRVDGELTVEQERQVNFIRSSARSLIEMVNDLLDLAKIEAGKTTVRPVEFTVAQLFGALRGTFRPLATSERVSLVIEDGLSLPSLRTDEAKVAQILRNFISNALKFTEQGEVRVRAAPAPGDRIAFSVRDTGIGIAPEDQERIFEEFSQVEHSLQWRATGTGLGLPLSRRLAELLGGWIELESAPGHGATFTVVLPRVYQAPAEAVDEPRRPRADPDARSPDGAVPPGRDHA